MANRLASAYSRYLLQHKDNPVDWYPWGDEAFAEAAQRDVPLFISIGYAACHWCHVMAHESFENPAIAEALNARFVSVKVDREELPDVDSVYMAACQAMTGQGGWPLSIFALPDGRAFYAGTYFPPAGQPGRPSFRQILDAVWEAWTERRDGVERQAAALAEGLGGVFSSQLLDVGAPAAPVDAGLLSAAVTELARSEDREHGGFGRAPKFPPSPVLEFLVRHAAAAGETSAVARGLAGRTLAAMCRSALFDALGGGFARYSVTADWSLPHYEKMLYDNAQLLRVLAHWVRLGGSADFPADEARTAAGLTAEWLVRELGLPEGGFASSLDADSERDGRSLEGGFYVWTRAELTTAVGGVGAAGRDSEDDGARLAGIFGLPSAGHAAPLHAGRALEPDERDLWERLRPSLLSERSRRMPPARDDKVVAGWNGLAVAALADAAWALGRPELLDDARRAAELLRTVHWDGGRLLRVSHEGAAAGVEGLLADYAGCAEGALALYAATGEERWYVWAEELLGVATQRFVEGGLLSDAPAGGGTAGPGVRSALAGARSLEPHDAEAPSGASLLAGSLLAHAAYSGSSEHRVLAGSILAGLPHLAAQGPRVVGWLLAVAQAALVGPLEVAVVGAPGEDRRRLHGEALASASPGAVIAVGEAAEGEARVPLLAFRAAADDGAPLAYVCRDFACRLPVSSPEELRDVLAHG
ncbi:thioredoxin domain-containing protein [Sinomonas sp. ASV322]|uniref:thioredoxin domain-containing protein n=1 Tax=Sinomonas sp. ASV322 TaxID=3041920 RepID=UPI0027DC3C04|nr:thioredoxin domain-containing protein [Sinomonas sp. ASV322]MDQ4503671.1 thioredoxin domain-containing protein [Sinomonas sp. ASV322]